MEDSQKKVLYKEVEKELKNIFNKHKKDKIHIKEFIDHLNKIEYFNKKQRLKRRVCNIIKTREIDGFKLKNNNIEYDFFKINDVHIANKQKIKNNIRSLLFFCFLCILLFLYALTKTERFITYKERFINYKKNFNDDNFLEGFKYVLFFIITAPFINFFMHGLIHYIITIIIFCSNYFFDKIGNLQRDFFDNYNYIYIIIIVLIAIFILEVKNYKIKLIPNVGVLTFLFSLSCLFSYLLKIYLNIHILNKNNYSDFLDIYSIIIFLYIIIILKNLKDLIAVSLLLVSEFLYIFLSVLVFYLFLDESTITVLKHFYQDVINFSIQFGYRIDNINHKDIKDIFFYNKSYHPSKDDDSLIYFELIILMHITIYIMFIIVIFLTPYITIKTILDKYCLIIKYCITKKIESFINEIFKVFKEDDDGEDKIYFHYRKFNYKAKWKKILSILFFFFILIWFITSDIFFRDLYYAGYTEKNNGYCNNINKDVYILKKENRILIDSKYLKAGDELTYKNKENKKERFFYYPCTFNEDYQDK